MGTLNDGDPKKIESQQIRGKESKGECLSDNQSKAGTRGTGKSGGSVSERISRTTRTGAYYDIPPTIAGGILTQLISATHDQLSEAVECIQWYERRRTELERRLDDLVKLRELLEVPED